MTIPLRDRLDAVAAAATDDIELGRPDLAPGRGGAGRPRRHLVLALVAFVALLAGVVWFAARERSTVDTVDGAPAPTSTPTWPAQPTSATAPTAPPRLVITAPGYAATSARESDSVESTTSVDPLAEVRPRSTRFFRRVDDPWALIEISTFVAGGDDYATQCGASPLGGAVVSETCDLSGREPGFDIESDGIAVSVSGKNVTADAVRQFVDELGGESVFGIDSRCCEALPDGWSFVGAVGPGDVEVPPSTAFISFDGPDGGRVDLLQFSGSSLFAFGELFAAGYDQVTVHEVGDRVVALAGPSAEPAAAIWMEGDSIVAELEGDLPPTARLLELIASLRSDARTWDRLLASDSCPTGMVTC